MSSTFNICSFSCAKRETEPKTNLNSFRYKFDFSDFAKMTELSIELENNWGRSCSVERFVYTSTNHRFSLQNSEHLGKLGFIQNRKNMFLNGSMVIEDKGLTRLAKGFTFM